MWSNFVIGVIVLWFFFIVIIFGIIIDIKRRPWLYGAKEK